MTSSLMNGRLLHSFKPFADRNAEILILGSMPGTMSLGAGEYYAHPRNAFWRILAEVTGVAPDAEYKARINGLKRARIALWDVLHSCRRDGSLDASIEIDAQTANDFCEFFQKHPAIRRVLFNGAAAAQCYKRHVLPVLISDLDYVLLPSTSPAHAALSFERKREVWRNALKRNDRSTDQF